MASFDWYIFLSEDWISGKTLECKMQTNVFFFRISHIDAPAAPKFTFLHPLIFMMPHLSHCALQLHSLCCILNFQMMLCIERQLEMEDTKMMMMVMMMIGKTWSLRMIWRTWRYLFIDGIKKQQTHTTAQAESIGSASSTSMKTIWVEMHQMHLLLSLVITNSNINTEYREHHSIILYH